MDFRAASIILTLERKAASLSVKTCPSAISSGQADAFWTRISLVNPTARWETQPVVTAANSSTANSELFMVVSLQSSIGCPGFPAFRHLRTRQGFSENTPSINLFRDGEGVRLRSGGKIVAFLHCELVAHGLVEDS